ncbi:hypothetical protein [Wolbachia endosymbiont (group B) of Erebia ligea]|uniref:hypothetical protein n=1 Tax=Wolbachia endosymbiont (group B) of Erebia ligea TaxID=2954010 RepID=UPI0021F8FF65|nr:hypothetical protein [Wolbachia endosymbiont (group B) of Erebia ligea]
MEFDVALEEDDDEFFDAQIDHQELRKAISNIIGGIVKSSSEEKKALLSKISNTVDEIDIYELKLVINSQGLEKAINKELFTKLIEEALEDLTPESVNSKIIEEALKSVNQQAISNVINNNKGPLDNLVNYFKSASANEKIGMASTGIVLGVAFSPLIVLATLIALVAIGALYVGIGIGKAGEKIKEGAIDAGKAVRGSYKDLIDKLPTIQARENNFDKFKNDLSERIIAISTAQKREEAGEDETKNNLSNMLEVVKMLQNEVQQSAIKKLVEEGVIKNFSKDDMTRLLKKGLSTHLDDQEALDDLIYKFQPEIMAIGNGKIEDVEQKVNEKAQKIEPSPKLDSSSAERVSEEGKGMD